MEVFRPYGFDKTLFFVMLAMISFGLVMVYSSSAILAGEKYNNSFHFLIHQSLGAGLGLVFILIMMSLRRPFYQDVFFIYGLLLISFLLLALSLFMPTIAKTNRWIQLFGLRFQPAELAKISLILFFAHYLDRKKERITELKTLLFPIGVLISFSLLLIKQPAYRTAVLVFIIFAMMLFIGGFKLKYFLSLSIFSLLLFVVILMQAAYRMGRIIAFLSPTQDPQGKGFQVLQSQYAIGAGGLFGVSIGESIQKLFFLPCAHTDYIYAIIGEELGLLGTAAVLLLFLLFLWRGLAISWNAPNHFSQILAAGLTLAIVFQAFLNISIVLGLCPPTGLPLPLFSYGRSSLLCTMFAVGILLHISQRRDGRGRKR